MINEFIAVYITTPSEKVAEEIGRLLVQEKLGACANILPQVKSIYEWQGEIQTSSECLLIVKTRNCIFNRLVERVRDLHPYDCPCIVSLPLQAGSVPFLTWIKSQTL